ncbi:MAG TPA: glycosyltransferase family 39 protein [Candidatus Paceibacterota bacterium]
MNKKKLLFLILILAASLRLLLLSQGDALGDETILAFRSIGMLDFDNAEHQTTPLEWFDPEIPWWTKLSFHDHPPLTFLFQNISMKILGESFFALRLPSAVFGLLSVLLIYLIGKRIFGENGGLLSALIFAITANHVFISRIGLQESIVIFFLLAVFYFLLRSLENDKYLIYAGAALGLALLSKYTAAAAIPISIIWIAFVKPVYLKKKSFWLGALLTILILSPVIFYNIKLYERAGHFDFQLSYVFGQKPEAWKVAPGKESVGGLSNRVSAFIPNLFASHSWLFLAISLVSTIILFFRYKKFPGTPTGKNLLAVSVAVFALFMLVTGPTRRFLTMLTPFLTLTLTGLFLALGNIFRNTKISFKHYALGIFFVFELLYSLNSAIIAYPKGLPVLAFSETRYENYSWGYKELDDFLTQELTGKTPAFTFDAKYEFLKKIQDANSRRDVERGLTPYSALIVYDDRIYNTAKLWIFDRRQIYRGWPVISASEYGAILNKKGTDYFTDSGFKAVYLIKIIGTLPLKNVSEKAEKSSEILPQTAPFFKAPKSIIRSKRGEEIFVVYEAQI